LLAIGWAGGCRRAGRAVAIELSPVREAEAVVAGRLRRSVLGFARTEGVQPGEAWSGDRK